MVSDKDEEEDDESPQYKFYRSEKILGTLYREVDEMKVWHEDIKTTLPTGVASFWHDFLLAVRKRCADVGCVAWHGKLEQAHHLRHVYVFCIPAARKFPSLSVMNALLTFRFFF